MTKFSSLAPDTLFTKYMYIVQSYSQYRYLAYRSFVSWCWGFLGRRIRVVIPACVVLRIRREFPDALASYEGFRPPLHWTWTQSCLWRTLCLAAHNLHTGPLGCWSSLSPPCMVPGPQRLFQRPGPSGHPHTLCNIDKQIFVYNFMLKKKDWKCIYFVPFIYILYLYKYFLHYFIQYWNFLSGLCLLLLCFLLMCVKCYKFDVQYYK